MLFSTDKIVSDLRFQPIPIDLTDQSVLAIFALTSEKSGNKVDAIYV